MGGSTFSRRKTGVCLGAWNLDFVVTFSDGVDWPRSAAGRQPRFRVSGSIGDLI
jgi:hypothetical protein